MDRFSDGIRVLHVDDEPEFAELVATFLEREEDGFCVETATGAGEALDRLDTGEFDCVVSDYDMPGRNGIEFLQAVRNAEAELPFILYTGKGSEEVASEAISAGVTDYLQKRGGPEQYELLATRIKHAVDKARIQTERQRHLHAIETAREGIAFLDDDLQFTSVNGAYAGLFGYEPGEMAGESWRLVYPDADIADAVHEIALSLREEGYFRGETTFQRADGSTFVGDHVVSMTAGKEYVCLARDITERKRRQRELERYETVVENLPVGVVRTTPEGGLLDANSTFASLVEADSTAQLQGTTTRKLWDPVGDRRLLEEALEGGMDTKREVRLATLDGQSRWLEVTTTLTREDGDRRLDWFLQDVTERKRREQEVRRQREQLQRREEKLIRLRDYTQELMYAETVAETATVALRAVDELLEVRLGGVFTRSDTQEGLLEMVGVLNQPRMEKMYGGFPAFLRDAPAGTHSALAWEVFETGEPVMINDTAESDRLARKSPFGSLMMYPIGQHGVVLFAATTFEAFTETEEILLDLLANALKTAFDRLDRERELRQQRNELEWQNERLDEFVSVVSHDLRNPLAVLDGRLGLAEETGEAEHFEHCRRAIERMSELIDDLLTLARKGETIEGTDAVSLDAVASECWETVATGEGTLVVETERTVRADRSRLRQLLENLFRNAVEHGGATATVRLGDAKDGFFVADDGPGIPPDERETVFETGHSTTDGGNGLGLSIVKQVVDAHGWEISVTDSENDGARFEVTGVETA